jgi:hypothetical protein
VIFNDDLLFIHIGKTGGMSCSEYLLRHLRRPVFSVHGESEQELRRLGIDDVRAARGVHRHCTLSAALRYLGDEHGRTLADFAMVIAVFRHPVTLEYSLYRHLQKPAVRTRRRAEAQLLELAAGDFLTFVSKAGYHRPGLTQDAYVRIDGEIPDGVRIQRFESLARDFPRCVAPYTQGRGDFPHNNRSRYDVPLREQVGVAELEAIHAKHRFLFDSGFYAIDDW